LTAVELKQRADRALADARHAYDYGTRNEFAMAVARAREIEGRRLVQCILDENPRVAAPRDIKRYVLRVLPEGWPDFGPDPARWGRRR